MSFSCRRSRDPRDLRSFPTRRSSDLGLGGQLPELAGEVEHAAVREDRLADAARGGLHGLRLGVRDAAIVRDRKSTRLNSSHPSISYAVFCLKKKKKILQSPVVIAQTI